MTLAEFLDREWRPAILPTYKASTRKQYTFLLSRFIMPRFGDWLLHEIRQQPVQMLVTSLNGRVAPKTIRATDIGCTRRPGPFGPGIEI